MTEKNKAVILLSGGLDSFVTAAIARSQGYSLTALSFLYGQKHSVEMKSAEAAVGYLSITDHRFVEIETGIFRSSLISGSGIEVPKNRDTSDQSIPSTYVPARNILFLSYALALAESIGASGIFIGANAVDYSGYPDCRPEFFSAFNAVSSAGTKCGTEGHPVIVHTPIISMTKSEIIKTGASLGLDFSLTHSCYDPIEDLACGRCDSCIIRKRGFEDARVPDATRYYTGR